MPPAASPTSPKARGDKCLDCNISSRNYGLVGVPGKRWCLECSKSHTADGEQVENKNLHQMCEDCMVVRKSFGVVGGPPRWCSQCSKRHASEGQITSERHKSEGQITAQSQRWSAAEDKQLREAVEMCGTGKWDAKASAFGTDRTCKALRARWKLLRPHQENNDTAADESPVDCAPANLAEMSKLCEDCGVKSNSFGFETDMKRRWCSGCAERYKCKGIMVNVSKVQKQARQQQRMQQQHSSSSSSQDLAGLSSGVVDAAGPGASAAERKAAHIAAVAAKLKPAEKPLGKKPAENPPAQKEAAKEGTTKTGFARKVVRWTDEEHAILKSTVLGCPTPLDWTHIAAEFTAISPVPSRTSNALMLQWYSKLRHSAALRPAHLGAARPAAKNMRRAEESDEEDSEEEVSEEEENENEEQENSEEEESEEEDSEEAKREHAAAALGARARQGTKNAAKSKATRLCEDCGLYSKNFALPNEGVRRWCGGCAKTHGAVNAGTLKSKLNTSGRQLAEASSVIKPGAQLKVVVGDEKGKKPAPLPAVCCRVKTRDFL